MGYLQMHDCRGDVVKMIDELGEKKSWGGENDHQILGDTTIPLFYTRNQWRPFNVVPFAENLNELQVLLNELNEESKKVNVHAGSRNIHREQFTESKLQFIEVHIIEIYTLWRSLKLQKRLDLK